jgi:hypothetical protein
MVLRYSSLARAYFEVVWRFSRVYRLFSKKSKVCRICGVVQSYSSWCGMVPGSFTDFFKAYLRKTPRAGLVFQAQAWEPLLL